MPDINSSQECSALAPVFIVSETDGIILGVLKKLRGARFKELARETRLSDATLDRHLKSLARSGVVIRIDNLYGLPEQRCELERKASERRARKPSQQPPEEHVLNITSGLVALVDTTGVYDVVGGPPSDQRYAEPALQHLRTGYASIYQHGESVVTARQNEKALIERVAGLIWNTFKEKLSIELDHGLSREFAELLLRTKKAENLIQHDEMHRVTLGNNLLKSCTSHEEASAFEAALRKLLLDLREAQEVKTISGTYHDLQARRQQAHQTFTEGVKLLAMKLENRTEGLEGWCTICERLLGKKLSDKDTEKVKELLGILQWEYA